jgi:S-adenosylmethionine-dependent methyltransferase
MDTFDAHQPAWRDYCATPWARLRYAVVADILTRHLSPAQRVLDVGGGDGRDARPLVDAGHQVTVVDTSPAMLAEAHGLTTVEASLDDLPAGEWDVVLCHFLLQYRADTAADIARLVAHLRPGGLLSVIVPNDVGPVLSAAARRGPAAALGELGATKSRTVTFDTTVRRISDAELDAALIGLEVVGRYGIRCINDLVADEGKEAAYDDLLALELAVCGLEPFNRIGMFTHVIAQRPG